jgi:hypothetical protein
LRDDFSDGNYEGWQVANLEGGSSIWSVDNKMLVCNRPSIWSSFLMIGEEKWRNYSIEFDVKMTDILTQNFYAIGIGMRIQDVNNDVWCALGNWDGLKVWITVWSNPNFVKESKNPFNFELNLWYHLKGIAKEDNFDFYVDGKLLLFTAQEGDRFDYWVGNNERQWGLEVSGTIDEDLYPRHRAKIRQLLSNPFGVDGYVAMTKFSTRESIFSFHRYRKENKMTPSQNGSISRRGLSARFIQDEKETSRLILEANLLKFQQRRKEAARKFAQAARLEMKNSDELLLPGLLDLYYIHRFSAASCWAQAGNLYQAIQICEELLDGFELKPPLRQRIAEYLDVLETRVDQWMISYAPDSVAIAD